MTAITCIYVHALLTAIFNMNLGHPAASVILFLPLFWKDNLLNEWHRFLQVGCPSQYPAVRIEALKAA